MANTWSPFTETTSKITKRSSQGFSEPILVVFLCTLFLYPIHVECCIKVSYFLYISICIIFSLIHDEKEKVYFMYFILKKQKYFSGISSWHIFYHIHGTKTLLFTCRYQRFLDSQALSLINRSSEYPSHSWSQMLPTFLYHSWISGAAISWQKW